MIAAFPLLSATMPQTMVRPIRTTWCSPTISTKNRRQQPSRWSNSWCSAGGCWPASASGADGLGAMATGQQRTHLSREFYLSAALGIVIAVALASAWP